MSLVTDRSFENNLKDYSNENYLDSDFKLKKDYNVFIWNFLNSSIQKLNHSVDTLDFEDNSVYTGLSGIALTYLKLYEITGNKVYIDRAESLIKISLDNLSRERISFLCGDAGPLAIAAYISHLKGDFSACKTFVERLIKRSDKVLEVNEKVCDELLYGRVGYAYSLLFVKVKISSDLITNDLLNDLFNRIIESGKRFSKLDKFNDKTPLMFEWHQKKYIGAAHGLSGIIYILLRIIQATDNLADQFESLIAPTIRFLTFCKYSSGNYQSSTESETDKLVQFCHGAAGVQFMFNLAYKITRDNIYLEEAIKCGEITWKRGLLRKGYGLCHGVAGNGYTLIDLYNTTHDPKWIHRAYMFAKWCCTPEERQAEKPDRPYSLFEGLSGTIYFLLDILNPKNAIFPGFQL